MWQQLKLPLYWLKKVAMISAYVWLFNLVVALA
jgi:hypothetical protein